MSDDEKLDLYGPWFRHPDGRMVDASQLPKETKTKWFSPRLQKVMEKTMNDEEDYLGDGCYVSFDGWQFRLRVSRNGRDEFVFMDSTVLKNFLLYVKHAC